MERLQFDSRRPKLTTAVAIVGFGLGAWLARLEGQACCLYDKAGWLMLEALRVVLPLANWHGVPTYLHDGTRLLQHLLDVAACILTVFCVRH
jgi:hypothetical protein